MRFECGLAPLSLEQSPDDRRGRQALGCAPIDIFERPVHPTFMFSERGREGAAERTEISERIHRPGLETTVSRDRRIIDNQPPGYRSVPL